MNNRIPNEKNKVNKKRRKYKNLFKECSPVKRYEQLCYWRDHGRGKKEGLRFNLIQMFVSLTSRGMSIRMSLRYMADYLGASRTYISTLLSDLENQGYIVKTYPGWKKAVHYKLTGVLRSPEMQFYMCSLFYWLKAVTFSFFCFIDQHSDRNHRYSNEFNYKELRREEKNTYQKRDENISSSSDSSPPLEKNLLKPENVAENSARATRQYVPNFKRTSSQDYNQKNGIPNPYKGDNPVDIKNILDTIRINGGEKELARLLRTTEQKRPERYEQY